MHILFNLILVSFLISLSPVHAWHLDRRCVDLGYEDLVKDGMRGALDFAAAAVDALDALSGGTNNAAQLDLFEYMFGFAVKPVNGRKQISQEELEYIRGIYHNVLKFAVMKDDKKDDDVVIYCDYSRYIEGVDCNGVEDSKAACDTDTGKRAEIDSMYKACKSRSAGLIPVMALTLSNGLSNFGQVDICGWYLEFSSKSKIRFWWELGVKTLFVWPIHAGYNAIYQRTRMDAYALMDHTLMHELTHAISVRPTDDVADKTSYGWKRCVEFGTQRSLGRFNADNYAYFALGARMISPTDGKPPRRPNKNGSISPLPSS